jgi:hypothetical protein
VGDPQLVPVADFRGAIEGEVIAFSVGPAGEAIVLAAAHSVAGGYQLIGPGIPVEGAYDATLATFDDEDLVLRRLHAMTATFPIVQPLPGGDVLVVGRPGVSGGGCNATVYGRDGGVAREFLLGDGIEDVQTTRDGGIWVAYFDEGIFGWWPAGHAPPAASGLARFDGRGSVEWEFEPPPRSGPITDCYALNVGEDVVWAHYCSPDAFPLARISEGDVATWKTPLSVAHAVAVTADCALFVDRGSRNGPARCILCRFGHSSLVEERRFALTTPAGEPLAARRIAARGSSVYVLDGTRLYRMDCTGI